MSAEMRRTNHVVRYAFFAASVGWSAVLPATSLIASRAHAPALFYAAAAAVYGVGALMCHQLPARSFHLWTVQMPVCARCAGIYVGAAITSLVALVPRMREPRSVTRLALLVAATPTLLTLAFEWWTGQMPANWIRAAAGLPAGAIVTALVVAATGDQVN